MGELVQTGWKESRGLSDRDNYSASIGTIQYRSNWEFSEQKPSLNVRRIYSRYLNNVTKHDRYHSKPIGIIKKTKYISYE